MTLTSVSLKDVGANTILQDIARARENIQKSLAGVSALWSSASYFAAFFRQGHCVSVYFYFQRGLWRFSKMSPYFEMLREEDSSPIIQNIHSSITSKRQCLLPGNHCSSHLTET